MTRTVRKPNSFDFVVQNFGNVHADRQLKPVKNTEATEMAQGTVLAVVLDDASADVGQYVVFDPTSNVAGVNTPKGILGAPVSASTTELAPVLLRNAGVAEPRIVWGPAVNSDALKTVAFEQLELLNINKLEG